MAGHLQRKVASRLLLITERLQYGQFFLATVLRKCTPLMKRATGRRVDRGRQLAMDGPNVLHRRTIGRKARDGLRRLHGARFVESYEVGLKAPNFALVKPIAQQVLNAYQAGEYDVVTLIHSSFTDV
jgi:hypothetical protein